MIRDFLLGFFLPVLESKTQLHNLAFPQGQLLHCPGQECPIHLLLKVFDHVTLCPQNINPANFVTFKISVQGLLQGDLCFGFIVSPQEHADLIIDALGGIGRQFYIAVGVKGVYRLDQANGADGHQVLNMDAGVVKFAGNVHHQPQIVLNEGAANTDFPLFESVQQGDFTLL